MHGNCDAQATITCSSADPDADADADTAAPSKVMAISAPNTAFLMLDMIES